MLRDIAYRSFWLEKNVVSKFGEMAVDLVCVFPGNTLNSLGSPYSTYPPNWIHKGVYDWQAVDKQFDDMIEANPSVRFLCMIDLNTPPWMTRWCNDREDSFTHLGKLAASEEWRGLTDEYLAAMATHVEGKYGERVEGYILMCGMTDEWQDFSKGEESPSRRAAWRKWSVSRGYGDPVDIPPKSRRDHCEHGLLRDPQTDAVGLRYADFTRWLISDTILHFTSQARKSLGKKAKIGVFYGYVLEHAQNRLISEGHLGFDTAHSSPDIDFIVSPSSYQDRETGGASAFMLTIDSLKLHGKGFFREIDHFTPSSNGNPLASLGVKEDRMASWNYRWPDEKNAIAGLRREFALDLIQGHSFWWFDMWGGWYETKGILDALASLRAIWRREQSREAAPSASQIALVVDSESCLYLNENDPRVNDVLCKLRPTLGRLGAPYSIFSFADLEAIDFTPFKLVVFPNLFVCDERRKELLQRKVLNSGRSVLFLGLAGAIANGRYDEENVKLLTGLPFAPGKSASMRHDGWTSILHSDFIPSWSFLRQVAQEAGAHLYCDGGEAVYANGRFLATHSASGGRKTFKLPRNCKVTELFSGRLVSESCHEFEDVLEAPGTVLYELTALSGQSAS